MCKHYLLISDPPWAGPIQKRIKGKRFNLSRGRRVEFEDNYEFILEVDKLADDASKFPPLDFHRHQGQPIFSLRLRQLLTQLGVDNIQYIPAKVVYEPTGKELDYQLANVLGAIKALNIDAADCTVSAKGTVIDFKKMVLREDSLQSIEFARIFEELSVIVISRKIANALIDAEISGIKVMRPSEWQPGMI